METERKSKYFQSNMSNMTNISVIHGTVYCALGYLNPQMLLFKQPRFKKYKAFKNTLEYGGL